jgi:hypothetical protein
MIRPQLVLSKLAGVFFEKYPTTCAHVGSGRLGNITMQRAMLMSAFVALLGTVLWAAAPKTETVQGYVLDSACAFTKGLEKPISRDCALACAKAGSPLVILSASGTIYWPIADTTPSSGQNDKLIPFAGQKVTATGKVFERGGSRAFVIEKIEPLASK